MQASSHIGSPQAWSDSLREIQRGTQLTPTAALTLFTFAVISMGGFMFSHSLGIDDELTLFSKDASWIRMLQGRFLMGLIDQLVPQSITPLFPYLLLSVCYLLAYTLILSIHGLSHGWKTHIGFLIFILFPTNWLVQEVVLNVPGFGLGLVATCAAALITTRTCIQGQGGLRAYLSPLAIAFLLIAVSSFQSLVTLYLTIGAGSLFFVSNVDISLARISVNKFFKTILPWVVNSLFAVAIHSLLFKVLLRVSNSSPHQVGIYFRSPYFMLRTQPASYLFGNINQFLQTYLRPGYFYAHSLWALTALVIGSLVIYAWMGSKNTRNLNSPNKSASSLYLRGASLLFCILCLLGFPLLLNVVSAPYRIPMRAFVALPYIAWFASSLWLNLAVASGKSRLHAIGVVLSALLVIQSLVTTSSYYAARAFSFRSDQLVASTLVSAINQASAPSQKPVNLLISQGILKRSPPYGTAWYSTAAGSFFNWEDGSSSRMVAWMRAMGIEGIKAGDLKLRPDLKLYFASMNSWPSPGSIRVIDGVALIKFSDPQS